jgi:hypothetical protein
MPRVPLSVWVVVGSMALLWMALGSRILPAARSHDFLNLYTGASLALEGRFPELHRVDVQLTQERRIFPQLGSLVPFVRPTFYALLLAPLALLPYNAAFTAWITFQSILLIGCFVWALRRFGPNALVFAAFYLPAPLGISAGQDCVEMLLIFILAYELLDRRKPFASGAALAVMLIKFHLILLWPLALLLQRRWRMLAGFCGMAAVEVAASLLLGGIQGAQSYIVLLRNKSLDRLSPSPEMMISSEGFLSNFNIDSGWVGYALVLGVLVVFLWAIRKAPVWRMFALTALASLFIVPHVYAYDGTLLLLPIWLLIFESVSPITRIAATLFSTPIPFGSALAGKPFAVISSASLLTLTLIVAFERSESGEENGKRRASSRCRDGDTSG